MNSPTKIQTVGEATSSIKGAVGSTFDSLANLLNISQLKDSFFQNIIFIFIVIIILVGILVYIQMVGVNSVNPLNLPPSKQVKKIEIQKVVEGLDMEQYKGIENNAETINTLGRISNYDYFGDNVDISQSIDDENLYNNVYIPQYKETYMNQYENNNSDDNNDDDDDENNDENKDNK
jgi:hypothetical protein